MNAIDCKLYNFRHIIVDYILWAYAILRTIFRTLINRNAGSKWSTYIITHNFKKKKVLYKCDFTIEFLEIIKLVFFHHKEFYCFTWLQKEDAFCQLKHSLSPSDNRLHKQTSLEKFVLYGSSPWVILCFEKPPSPLFWIMVAKL